MKLSSLKTITVFLFAIIYIGNAYSAGQEFDSTAVEQLDEALKAEFSPCSPEKDQNTTEQDTTISSVILSSDIDIAEGEMLKSSSGAKAILDSYNSKTKILKYHQTADTGFMLLSIGEIITDSNFVASIIIGTPKQKIAPCFERVVTIDEDAREMLYISEESLNDVLITFQTLLDKQRDKAASTLALLQEKLIQEEIAAFEAQLEAELAAQEMIAEMIAEQESAERLAEFQAKLEADKAAAAASTAAYQSQVEYDKKVAELMEQLALEKELAEFEAQLKAELAAQQMMAEMIAEQERAKRLAEFQAKLEAERAAAAKSTAIYQARLQQEKIIKDNQARLEQEAVEREIAEFEAEYEAQQAALAQAKRLAEFQAKLEAEKAAAAASTAAYQSKLAYEYKVNKIMEDLTRELELAKELDKFESQLAEELVAQATAKLEEEKVVGAISGEIVTVSGHESCKDTLNLSNQNIALFKLSLAGDYLYNVGPINQFGTEFSANRWDKYISCIGSYNE